MTRTGARTRCLLGAVLCLAALAVGPAPATAAPPRIRHVFVLVLENESFSASFGPTSPATYLNRTLVPAGQLLTQYYGIAHESFPNYAALISGQSPNVDTQADCQVYSPFVEAGTGPDGQALGQGCVYPADVKTVADQLDTAHLTWRGYMEDMGNDPARDGGTTCAHPGLNRDPTQTAAKGDQYAARHNPFVYFQSLIDSGSCARNDVPLTRLATDLGSAATTANFNLITPSLCHDGHDSPCVDGQPGGLVSADAFLRLWVPRILGSPAFKKDGLLVITFDEAATSDSSSCCNEPIGPNTPNNGATTPGTGGGRVGAVVLSPFVRPGTTNATPYNHYALLRSVEDFFGLSHLGYAGAAGLKPFGADVLDRPQGPPRPRVKLDRRTTKAAQLPRGRHRARRRRPPPRPRRSDDRDKAQRGARSAG